MSCWGKWKFPQQGILMVCKFFLKAEEIEELYGRRYPVE